MAQYDLPAMINFALQKSKADHLHYVGHSQGTLIAFAHLSKSPDLRTKIKSMYALGPVATVGYIKGALKPLSFFTEDFAVSFLSMYPIIMYENSREFVSLVVKLKVK